MYIGDLEDGSGQVNIILGIIGYFLNGSAENPNTNISIVIYENNEVEVYTEGHELPLKEINGKLTLEKLMTELQLQVNHLVIVNALSSKVIIHTTHEGNEWTQVYEHSGPQPITKIGKSNRPYTSIRFQIHQDYFHFSQLYFNHSLIKEGLQTLSYFNENLKISFEDRSIRKAAFHSSKGLTNCVEDQLMKNRHIYKESDIIKINGSLKGVYVEVAFGFVSYCGSQISFVNGIKSIEGGTHVKGFIAGIAKAINVLSEYKLNSSNWKRFISDGVLAAINVKLLDPRYSGSTRDKLTNSEVLSITKGIVSKQLISLLKENDSKCNELLEKYVEQYIQFHYRKTNDDCVCTSSKFVEELLIEKFDKPDKYKNLVEKYRELEKCLEECRKMQDEELN